MKKTPEIGRYLDDEEKALVQAFETGDAPVKSGLTPKRKREIEAMARATMTDERAKISLRVMRPAQTPARPVEARASASQMRHRRKVFRSDC